MSKILFLVGLLLSSWATANVKTVEEKWPDGSIKMRQQIAEDLRGKLVPNGLETHYYSGGVKESEITYRLGVKDGPWREFYLSGKLKIEGQYKHGQKDGPETLYSENGMKASEINYKDGQREGKKIEWQGKSKVYEAEYEKDRLVGMAQEWYRDGTSKSIRHYKAGVQDGQEQSWYPTGRKYIEANYDDGRKNGEYQEWFKNGKLKYHASYKQGSPDGKFEEWFEDGAPKSSGQYVNGQMDGAWKDWRELTNAEIRQYVKDHPSNKDKSDDSATNKNGDQSAKDAAVGTTGIKDMLKDAKVDDVAKDGEQIKDQTKVNAADTEAPPEHPLSGERNFRHGVPQGKQITYHPNGQKQLEVMVEDGKRDGPYTEWYENGQVRSSGKYFQDQLHGEINYWFEDGKPWAVNNYFHGSPVGHWVEWDRQGNPVTR